MDIGADEVELSEELSSGGSGGSHEQHQDGADAAVDIMGGDALDGFPEQTQMDGWEQDVYVYSFCL